jgi:16S rRNA (cytosine967-C5)-methyltransferase
MSLDVRVAAAKALAALMSQGQSLNRILPTYAEQVAPRDKSLLQELCFGCVRWQPRLQILAAALMDKPLKPKDADIQALLLLGLYQLIFMRVPDHAAINSCVEASKRLKKPWASRLLNGVLRNFQRRRAALEQDLATDALYQYSHPLWLLEALSQAWPEHWQAILGANNEHPPMTLRVNQRVLSRDDYAGKLKAAGVEATATPHSPVGLTLTKPADPLQLPGYSAGEFSVQDEAAQLAAVLLDLAPGQRVLDACCAPGGKTCHILEQEPELASVTALDVEAERLKTVQENLTRLSLDANLVAADAADPASWWDGEPFDRILLDAPCSATGVIRRHPDIKLLRRPSDIAKLAALQLQLLEAAWTCLKPGGRLVYATCSVMPQENEQVIAQFVNKVDDVEYLPIDQAWGVARPYGRQLFPQPGGHDGFYYACLHKRS